MHQPAGLSIYARGIAMGAADVVPGVSGGTIALITGIYERLLGALARVDRHMLVKVFNGDISGAWQHVDGRFLLVLLAGIATSIFLLAGLISQSRLNNLRRKPGFVFDDHAVDDRYFASNRFNSASVCKVFFVRERQFRQTS